MHKTSPIYELAARLVDAYREASAEYSPASRGPLTEEQRDVLTARLATVLEMEAASGRLTYTGQD